MSLSPAAATAAAAAGAATCCACAAARLAASSRRDDAGAKRSTNHDADLRDDGEHAFSFIDYQPERYGELLEERSVRVTRRFRELGLLRENVECEIHPSAPTHYRLRVGFGVYDPSRPDTWRLACSTSGDRLRYVYWDAGEMVPVANDTFPIASVTICRAMPLVLDWLSKEPALRAGIRATKFLSTLDGQLLVTLIYKGRGLGTKGWEPLDDQRPEPADDTWPQYAKAMQTALSAAQPDTVCVGVIGRSKNVRVVVGDSHVIETGIVLRDGRKLVYKQPEQAFSNPNGAPPLPCEAQVSYLF
jgi:tRNA (uracil-5-)-methyltransferase